jgi:hypothetical protein
LLITIDGAGGAGGIDEVAAVLHAASNSKLQVGWNKTNFGRRARNPDAEWLKDPAAGCDDTACMSCKPLKGLILAPE